MLLRETLSLSRNYGTNLMSQQSMSIKVEATAKFKKNIKYLKKKYRNIQADVQPTIQLLETGTFPGDRIVGLGLEVYKVRLMNTNVNRGESGGYRLHYYVETNDCPDEQTKEQRIILVTIYSKSEKESIPNHEIISIIAEFD
jgi:mRNA-degrading endonuclease RelE of RelBE toxin-antitoxin system